MSVCGEVAADPLAVPLLLGPGVPELSVAVSAVPTVKAAVRALDLPTCVRLADSSSPPPTPPRCVASWRR